MSLRLFILSTLSIFISISLVCCKEQPSKTSTIAVAYYETYQAKEDFEGFLKFYDKNIVLEDIINGDSIVGIQQLREFFNWNRPDLERTNPALVIEDQIIDRNKVLTKGYFTPFRWKGQSFEAMHFVTLLYFNETGKIYKQVDWINYPNTLVDYANRKNANQWIKGIKE